LHRRQLAGAQVDGIQRKLAAISTMMQVHSSREVEGLLATLNAKMCESVELQEQNARAAISLQLLQVRPPAHPPPRHSCARLHAVAWYALRPLLRWLCVVGTACCPAAGWCRS
jgi:hypothetical protein